MLARLNKMACMAQGAAGGSIVLRWRLLLYLAVLALMLLLCLLLLFFVLDAFNPQEKIEAEMQGNLERYQEHLRVYLGNTAAQGIHLSSLVAQEIERTLAEHEAGFADVSDNPRLIITLERNTFNLARSALLIADCSGVFITFDTTVNTYLPAAAHSRSGLYLKLANINVGNPVNPELLFTRGAHQVGLENNLSFHNKWQLEFTTNRKPFYRLVMEKASPDLSQGYFYAPVIALHGTGERIMLLFVPIVGQNGQVYGNCGFEISDMFFKLTQPVSEERDSRLTGLLAQKEGDVIYAATGLESGVAQGYFAELGGRELRLAKLGDLTLFTLADGRQFVGLYKEMVISPIGNDKAWVAACFMPKEDFDGAIRANYIKIALCCLAFVLGAIASCWYMDRKCIAPLRAGIAAVTSGAAQKTNIAEIDDLLEFLANSAPAANNAKQASDLAAFDEFHKNISTLSKAEKAVFQLYMQGLSAPQIADKLYVSINTIKTHNKNIYRKLSISSRMELMKYAQAMKGV